MPRRSRLSKVTDRKSKQNLLITIVGIIAILFLLIRYGIPFLGNIGYFFGQLTSIPKEVSVNKEKEIHVAAPRLDPIPKAQSESELVISGSADKGSAIEIFLNGFVEEIVEVDDDGDFQTTIILSVGENIIKARSIASDTESEFSDSITINFINEAPELSIDAPSDGQELKDNPYSVTGTTDPDVSVTVNGFKAITSFDNSYSYNLLLTDGGNEIKVVAKDLAGNTTEKIINIIFSP